MRFAGFEIVPSLIDPEAFILASDTHIVVARGGVVCTFERCDGQVRLVNRFPNEIPNAAGVGSAEERET